MEHGVLNGEACAFVVTAIAVGTVLVACASPNTNTEGVEDGTAAITASPLTTTDAFNRATLWSTAKLQYCWTPNGGNNHAAGDYSCATICKRQSNPQWDPYRSDCSGLVSWAWDLPAPGRTQLGFAPFQKDITTEIQAKDLRAGDAINNSEHVMLFKEWVVVGKTATFIEEPGCSSPTPYAHEVTSAVTLDGSSITPAVEGRSFTAIRYTKLALATTAPKTSDAGTNEPPIEPAPTGDDDDDAGTPSSATPAAKGDDGQPTTSESTVLPAPSPVDSGGCAVSHGSSGGTFAFGLALVLAARRRRSRRK